MSITVVQHASATATYTSGISGTLSPVFAGATAANNALVACITLFEDPEDQLTITSVTTNGAAENWLSAVNIDGGATNGDQFAIWVNGLTAGSQTVVDINFSFGYTVTTSSSVCALADIYEVAGIANPAIDKNSTATSGASTATTWTSGATSNTSRASEIWFGMAFMAPAALDTTTTVTGPSSPWVNSALLTSSAQSGGTGAANSIFVYQISGYQIVSSTGSATYSGTNSVSSYNSGLVVTFFQTNPNAAIGIPVGIAVIAPGGPVPLSSLGPQPGFAVASSNRDSLRRSPVVPIS